MEAPFSGQWRRCCRLRFSSSTASDLLQLQCNALPVTPVTFLGFLLDLHVRRFFLLNEWASNRFWGSNFDLGRPLFGHFWSVVIVSTVLPVEAVAGRGRNLFNIELMGEQNGGPFIRHLGAMVVAIRSCYACRHNCKEVL